MARRKSRRITKIAKEWERLGFTREKSLGKAFAVRYPNIFKRKSRREI